MRFRPFFKNVQIYPRGTKQLRNGDFGRDQMAALDRQAAPDATVAIVETIAAAVVITLAVATVRFLAKRRSR